MISSVVGNDKVDYKSAKKASTLDVPPDLTQLQKGQPLLAAGFEQRRGHRFRLQRPAQRSGGYARRRGCRGAVGVVPVTGGVKVERAATSAGWWSSRRLSAVAAAEAVLGRFGLHHRRGPAAAGIMETEWNENRAKIPQDFIRNTIGKVFDSLYSSGERDKFRTRIERRPTARARSTSATAACKKSLLAATRKPPSGRRVPTIRAWKRIPGR
jgi:outer membrane protein assembly factor BamC